MESIIPKIKCKLGFHTPARFTAELETVRKRKSIDATEVREWMVCEYCRKRMYPTGREGTMYELFGHTHVFGGLNGKPRDLL